MYSPARFLSENFRTERERRGDGGERRREEIFLIRLSFNKRSGVPSNLRYQARLVSALSLPPPPSPPAPCSRGIIKTLATWNAESRRNEACREAQFSWYICDDGFWENVDLERMEESRYLFSFWIKSRVREFSIERSKNSPLFSFLFHFFSKFSKVFLSNKHEIWKCFANAPSQSPCGKNVERFVRDRREHVFRSVTNSTGYRRPTLPRTTTTLLSTR